MLLWKTADKSDPPDVQLTDCVWNVKEHGQVMPAISREPSAPLKFMDAISCSCNAEGKARMVAMDPIECCVPLAVSVKEAWLF